MEYNYMESVKADVKEYIENSIDLNDFSGRTELEDKLNELLWVEDSVTGNASGSYTFNTYKAEENLAHNWDLLVECANEFGEEPIISDDYKHGAEFWDVSIRCYLLGSAISEVLDEMENDNELNFED